jgi:hypothetical protein
MAMDKYSRTPRPSWIRALSFNQLFHLFVVVATWDRPSCRFWFLKLTSTNGRDLWLAPQPAYASVHRLRTEQCCSRRLYGGNWCAQSREEM